MIFDKVSAWWRSIPQKMRVKLILMVLLLLAGTEVFVLAPYLLDIAVMIDVGGLVFVFAAVQASVAVSALQLRDFLATITQPFFALSWTIEKLLDFGSILPPKWYQRWWWVGRVTGRHYHALVALGFVALAVTKAWHAMR